MRDCAVFLCDRTGVAAQPWAEAGIECFCVDVQHSIRRDRTEGLIHFVWGDARSWTPPEGYRLIFVGAWPPCTHVSVSGTRDHAKKRGHMLRDTLEIFEACRQAIAWSGAPGFLENPVGILSSIPHIGKPGHYFDPWHYSGYEPSDYYTKKTCIWPMNGFSMPRPFYDEARYERGLLQLAEKKRQRDSRYPTPDYPDNRIHTARPSDVRGDTRSATPLGFSRAVFYSNAPDRYLERNAA